MHGRGHECGRGVSLACTVAINESLNVLRALIYKSQTCRSECSQHMCSQPCVSLFCRLKKEFHLEPLDVVVQTAEGREGHGGEMPCPHPCTPDPLSRTCGTCPRVLRPLSRTSSTCVHGCCDGLKHPFMCLLLLQMDVEGYETQVVKEAFNLFRRFKVWQASIQKKERKKNYACAS